MEQERTRQWNPWELGLSAALSIVALVLLRVVRAFPEGLGRTPGPAVVPRIVLVLLLLLLVPTVIVNVNKWRHDRINATKTVDELDNKVDTTRVALSILAVILYSVMALHAGSFVLTTGVFLFAFSIVLEKPRKGTMGYVSVLLFATASAIALNFLFIQVLRIPL
jgi:hypothetical protein